MLERKEILKDIFSGIDKNEQKLIGPLIDEVLFLENQMIDLKKLPFIRVHSKDPSKQEITKAAKLYKECSQSYMNAIRILCSLLHKVDSSATDELLKKLSEFE